MAIDTNDTQNNTFESPDSLISENFDQQNENMSKNNELPLNRTKPKYQTFDQVTTLLTSEQKNGLDMVAKKIMKQRASVTKGLKKERITANTLIRSLVESFLEVEKSTEHGIISSEKDALEWIRTMFKN